MRAAYSRAWRAPLRRRLLKGPTSLGSTGAEGAAPSSLRVPALLLAILAASAAVARGDGPAFLVANINRGVDPSAGSWPSSFTAAGGFVYFVADDGTHGRELWRTDRTAAGTALVADLVQGTPPYYNDVGPHDLTALGEDLYFGTDEALWRVHGAGKPEQVEPGPAWSIYRLGRELLFERGEQIWITDGTPGAARWVAPAPTGDAYRFASDSRVFALECGWQDACSLWSSDGTPAGTGFVRQLSGGPLQFFSYLELPLEHAAIGDVVYFPAETAEAGIELWRSDGTADGTWMVRDINPGPGSAFPIHYDNPGDPLAYLAAVNGELLFVASDGTSGFELWHSDGTAAGTQPVADLVPGADGLFDCVATDQACDDYTAPAVLDGVYYIAARQPGDDGVWQLWRSDGTAAGTRVLETGINPHIVASDGQLFFIHDVDWNNAELRRRGTDGASVRIAALGGWVSELTALPGGIAFSLAPSDIGWWSGEPWWSDGTETGTYLLRDIRGDDASSSPRELLAFGDALLFSADDGIHGRELWRSDATAAGTALVADIAPGATGSEPQRPVRLGDVAFFSADDGLHGRELWRSDGTAAGTALVADIRPGVEGADLGQLTVAGAFVYFFADDGVHGRELWRSDGTTAGTVLIADLNPGMASGEFDNGYFSPAVALGDALIVVARDDLHGTALWRTAGAPGDLRLLTDFGGAVNWVNALAAVDGAAWVSVETPTVPAVWRTDGTVAGTQRSTLDLEAYDLAASGGGMYARVAGTYVDSVWRLDGAGGPVEVLQPEYSWYRMLDADGVLIGGGEAGLWRLGNEDVEGTPSIEQLFAFGRRLLMFPWPDYYDALDLWTSSGSDGDSFLLQTLPMIDFGRRDSPDLPAEAVAAGGHVFFAAETGDIGEELWALPFDALPELCTEDCPGLATPTPTATEIPQPTPTPTCDSGDCTTVRIGRVTAAPGERVSVPVTLASRGEPIAGVLVDIAVTPPLRIANTERGRPDCQVDPAIGKDSSAFVFQPGGCDPARDCTAVRALIISLLDVKPIPDGSTLLTCAIAVDPHARAGEYPLASPRAEVSSPQGWPVPFGVREGAVTVVRAATRSSGASTASGCEIDESPRATGIAWPTFLLLLVLGARVVKPWPQRRKGRNVE